MFELKTVAVIAEGCFGALLFAGKPFAVTCEWVDASGRPVIGNGVHRCTLDYYHAGGYPTYEIHVAGHSLVKFHKGNRKKDSRACVLVAESFTVLEGETAIGDSKGGFEEFMRLANGVKEFELVVSGR